MLPTTHSPLSFQLRHQMANYTPLRSTPGPFPLRNSTMTSTTKSSSRFLKLSNNGDITSKALDFRLTWSPIDHQNLKYLSGFTLIIRFHPGKLRTKPNALTRRWGIYLKEGNSDYASVNPQNFHLVFTSKQLASSLRATTLSIPVLRGSLIMDAEKLHSNIRYQLREDPISAEHLDKQSDSWTLDPDGLLRNSGWIYILDSRSLRLRVLQYTHDHPLAGHFSQTKTLHQVRMHY